MAKTVRVFTPPQQAIMRYKALISQISTNDPILIELENTYKDTMQATRLATGHYRIHWVNTNPYGITDLDTAATIEVKDTALSLKIVQVAANIMDIYQVDSTQTPVDGINNQTVIQISTFKQINENN